MPQEPARKRSLCRIGSIPALAAVRQSRRLTDATRKTPDRREAGIIGGGLSALGGIASAAGTGQTSCEAHRRGGRSISGNIAGSGIPPVDQILSRRRLARMNDPYTAINCNCWASQDARADNGGVRGTARRRRPRPAQPASGVRPGCDASGGQANVGPSCERTSRGYAPHDPAGQALLAGCR